LDAVMAACDGRMFKAAVPEATGRDVLTVISGVELEQEMATEVFVLAPS
jgi:hypothetical protein